jgi:hypothetical protein
MTAAAYADIDELIGGPSDEDEVASRRTLEITSYDGNQFLAETGISLDLTDVHAGVTPFWLASVFGMGIATVKKKLAGCPPIKKHRNGTLYDLRQAVNFIAAPKVDAEKYIKSMRPEDLPIDLQKEYWQAKRERRKYEEDIGELWRSEDVLSVLGEAFAHIKSSTQLWAATIERTKGLTPDQQTTLVALTDRLLDDLHEKLIQMPKRRQTKNVLALEAEESARGEDV